MLQFYLQRSIVQRSTFNCLSAATRPLRYDFSEFHRSRRFWILSEFQCEKRVNILIKERLRRPVKKSFISQNIYSTRRAALQEQRKLCKQVVFF